MHVTYLHCVEILVIWRDVEPLVRRPEYVVDNFDFGLFFERIPTQGVAEIWSSLVDVSSRNPNQNNDLPAKPLF